MTKRDQERLRAYTGLMPKGRYTYYDRESCILSDSSEVRRPVLSEVFNSVTGHYYELLTPDNVLWLLDKINELEDKMEDDLK